MRVDTVNIIEYDNVDITSLVAFGSDNEGMVEAEGRFTGLIKGKDDTVTDEEMADYIKTGYYEQGNYQLFMLLSTG